MSTPTPAEVEEQVAAWVDENWSPDLTCAEWWQLLADAGYSAPMLPEEAGGKGWTRDLAHAVTRTLAAKEVLGEFLTRREGEAVINRGVEALSLRHHAAMAENASLISAPSTSKKFAGVVAQVCRSVSDEMGASKPMA